MSSRKANGFTDAQTMFAMSVDDAYDVERVLACGGGSVTELVRIDGSGPFVRKRLPLAQANRGVWAALAECRCPYLPRVRATYEMPDAFVAVYDFVEGETLERVVAARGALSVEGAVRVGKTLCEAAEELHARGIVHRDISPSNVVLAADGAHLIDLGIARRMDDARAGDAGAYGTWGFAAPEQYGFADTDARSDVYSLGRVLAFALTGVRPDADGFEKRLADASVVPETLQAVIARAASFEPSARYQTAADLRAALVAAAEAPGGDGRAVAADGSPAAAPGAAAIAPSRDSGAGHRRLQVAISACVAALAVAVAAGAAVLGGGAGADAGVGADAMPQLAASAPDAADASAATSDDLVAQAVDALSIVESGWSIDATGYVSYAFGLRNESDALKVELPEITITGRDASGGVLFVDTQVLPESLPGQTLYFAGIAGNGAAPASVEFSIVAPADYNIEAVSGAQTQEPFAVESVSEVSDGFGGVSFVGEVSATGGEVPDLAQDVMVTVVLRDESGIIVSGASATTAIPSPGRPASFEVPMFGVPAHAIVEAYAIPW